MYYFKHNDIMEGN